MKNIVPALGLALILAGCGGGGEQQQQQPAGPPQVGVVEVRDEAVTLTTELPGRTSPFETSDVRPQVNGLILARLFQEGDFVREGQPLYRIDPAPYQAQVANARAGVARARAAIASSAALARRYGELVKINAISRQELENATTSAQQAQADVAAQQAALRTAQIDLNRTTLRAPISGRIGRSVYTTGALVSASQTDPLTTIQRLDPIYVDIQQSSADLLRLRQQIMSGELARGGGAARVRLKLEDGSTYPQEGTLKFADVTVDPATGSQTIRAVFPNTRGLLLPGMFVRAELVEGTRAHALVVPQRGVTRDERGQAVALVVGADGKLAQRVITAPRTVGQNWLVTGGLKAGDKVVVEGAQNLQPGTPVKAVPYRENAGQQGGQPGNQAGAQQGAQPSGQQKAGAQGK
ncbi:MULTISPECIES: efflux RND transporter periplasmic adaptor subunit [Sphingomonas]|uniref:Efflux RND transporter periplasmic adaptor subunit n=1 Tax=Sphingomonas carotinifaciens TaxID=1166323 RepID=A0A1G7QSD3_9SPHN|nr:MULTISPECIES: efflux RND transporter periplasmic adaptor subunit [Sphingomonas]MBB4087830.1 membrane fusion protein (multidrug efflux system) [Sphingomonas carotinifaciens]MWC42334.1 efflux RND transporter periplasmic adaptor subunit [Sphingomonas carotinifaciens]SDG01428.1 membrane fusion protein, multidrug efflux system [Sphingomonas carotinifaciens]